MSIVERDKKIQIERIETSPFGTNAYILLCIETGISILVDAPGEAKRIYERLEGTIPKQILITHSHMDHTGALRELRSRLNIPVAAHSKDADKLPCPVDSLLKDNNTVSFGKIEIKVLHTPGHTPGSLCFLKDRSLIAGDTLFPGGPGKTGTPANFNQIVKSIREKIFVLPDEVQVYPGHGDSTVLKKEKDEFAVFSSRPHPSNLCGDVLWLQG